jgi:hypothetical protein
MDLTEIGFGSTDWINLVQDRYLWRVLANTEMNLWVPKMLENSLVSEKLMASKEGFSSMELAQLVRSPA